MDQLPLITLTELKGNEAPQLNTLQKSIEPYAHILTWCWIFIWIVTACVILTIVIRTYRQQRS